MEKASIDKVLANAEIKTMINAFGCGFSEGYGNDFDITFPLLSKEYFCFVRRFVFAFSSVFRIFAAFSAQPMTLFK